MPTRLGSQLRLPCGDRLDAQLRHRDLYGIGDDGMGGGIRDSSGAIGV